jgi:hypothetical protein
MHMRIAQLAVGRALGILLLLPAGLTFAQSAPAPPPAAQAEPGSDALAAAAKRARGDRKDQAKEARVWDNDNIPKAGHEISVIGQKDATANEGTTDAAAGAASANPGPAVAAGAGDSPESAGKQGEHLHAQIDAAKERIASLRTDLELMQRTLVLDSQMYYGKTDYSSDTEGARKLQDEQAQIAEKQQAIDDTEKQMADLESQLKDSPESDNPPAKHD